MSSFIILYNGETYQEEGTSFYQSSRLLSKRLLLVNFLFSEPTGSSLVLSWDYDFIIIDLSPEVMLFFLNRREGMYEKAADS